MYMKSLEFLNKIKSISLVSEQYIELVFLLLLENVQMIIKCLNGNNSILYNPVILSVYGVLCLIYANQSRY